MLISELERGLLNGSSPAGAPMVLAELRRSLREGGGRSSRFDDAARLFFQPIEPFLVDDVPEHGHRGRIARAALEPLWLWVTNTLMPDEAKAYARQVDDALLAGESGKAEHAGREFHDRARRHIQRFLESATEKERARLGVHLGTTPALNDIQTLCDILGARDRLTLIGTQLPGHIHSFGGTILESVKSQLDRTIRDENNLFLSALVLLMVRLGSPWQLIRLATKAAGGDNSKRIAETSYSVAIDIVLEEVDRRIRELASDLKNGRRIAVSALLKETHDALRGLRSELDVPQVSRWARQLAAIHTDVSKLLTTEIELTPGRVRRLVRQRPSKEIAPNSVLDKRDVDETEASIELVLTCRKYASELAINEVTQRTLKELQYLLDSGTRALLDAIRDASPGERVFRMSQVQATVRFCAKVYGHEYASLLAKAAEVAADSNKRRAAGA